MTSFYALSQNCEKWLLYLSYLSVRTSVRLSVSDPIGRIFMKFDIWVFFEKLSGKFKFHYI